jgi:hypothetical protein
MKLWLVVDQGLIKGKGKDKVGKFVINGGLMNTVGSGKPDNFDFVK